jgi:hypothetical protein
MQDFQELADEAFRDLLEKHGRPTDLKTALRRSVENSPVIKAGRRSIGWRGSTSAFSARARQPAPMPRSSD